MRKSNRVAEMRITGLNVDPKTAPNFFIDHDVATVVIACPTIPYIMLYILYNQNRIYFYPS